MMDNTDMSVRKTRKALDIFSISIQYTVRHARSIFSSIALMALPLVVLPRISATLITDNYNALDNLISYKDILSSRQFIFLVLAYAVWLLGIAVFNMVINKQLVLGETGSEGKVPNFWTIQKDLLPDMRNFIISFLILYAFYLVLNKGLDYVITWLRGEGFGTIVSGDPLSYVISLLLLSLPYCIATGMALFLGFSTLHICYRDELGANDAFKKVWRLIQTNSRKAWGFSILLYAGLFISYSILKSIYFGVFFNVIGGSLSNGNFLMLNLLLTFTACFFVIYFQVAVLFLLGSLEDEAEGHSILKQIDAV